MIYVKDKSTGTYVSHSNCTGRIDVRAAREGGDILFQLTTENGGITFAQDADSNWYVQIHINQTNAAKLSHGVEYYQDFLRKVATAEPERFWEGYFKGSAGPTEW
jgi:hypothetical protein